MSIVDIIKQGLHIARTHKSLWLFAFVVGLGAGGSGGAGSGGGGQAAGGGPGRPVAVILLAGLIVLVAVIVIKFVSEGALIEGVTRAHRRGSLTMREGFRVGWANCGVLFRISAIYFAAAFGSLIVLWAPCVIAMRLGNQTAFTLVAIPTAIVTALWTVTLYMLQAFASRIAVLENRHALDAIRKARLFLHGRMLHALKLTVAAFVGTLVVGFAGIVALAPIALLLAAAAKLLGGALTLAIGLLILVPASFVLIAFIGTVQSAAWTLGYLAQTER
jgi:hypothetical protein